MATRNGGVMPCTNEDCRYPTRTTRAKANQYAFPTRNRRAGGICHVCHYKTHPKPPTSAPPARANPNDPPNPATLAAHNTFLAGRHARKAVAARRELAATHPDLARKQATR